MASIPGILELRYELLQQLESAYDLLESLRAAGSGSELEETFLAGKINRIEDELYEGEATAVQTIDLLQSDSVAWTIAHLRFMQGYQWGEAAARAGISEAAAKMRVYRAYKNIHEPVCEASVKYNHPFLT